jgi:hypothetical protein
MSGDRADIAEYAEAARAIGMDAIRFESPSEISVELARWGLPGK